MKRNKIILIIFLVIAATLTIVFDLPQLVLVADETKNILLKELFSRLILAAFIIYLVIYGKFASLKPNFKNMLRNLLWMIPCFLVALANFPFSALINGTAIVERKDLIHLLIINCVLIAIIEDFFFQGILRSIVEDYFKNTKHRLFFVILIVSTIFALSHLLNLLSGASIGATILQVGYTFLMGGLFSTIKTKTNDIWLIVLIHTIFDVGGTLINKLGSGVFQDRLFWIFTIIFGIIAGIYILINIFVLDKKDVEEMKKEETSKESVY
ncbi:CPBP family intramembrane metalloprotease [bacterium]|nr:CPBP family intramembrane metalloprotease [bacterium]